MSASPPGNAPEWTVSELAGALKRTLEDSFGFVRLRGEVSGYRGPHSSGHCYFSIKDQGARIDAVIWKSAFARLKVKPEEGLDVIATGRITTFPGKSAYQIVVETIEPAGIGALMAMLEARRVKLAAEGLFEAERKRKLPFLPEVIGVVTSPTGAVIRDILHRLAERFPRRVLVWPVRVQGETSGSEVAAAIRGFSALQPGGPIPRPDVIIVARGGGSLEDLWGFNDEAVVRAAADCPVPLVSAIGHETDWTLLDHVADLRAPTPTGAAEMVVPVRAELELAVSRLQHRAREAWLRCAEARRRDLRSAARALPTPERLLAVKRQRLDLAAARLGPALDGNARKHHLWLNEVSRRLARCSPAARLDAMHARLGAIGLRPREALARLLAARRGLVAERAARLVTARGSLLRAETLRIEQRRDRIEALTHRLRRCARAGQEARLGRLARLSDLFSSLNYRAVLARGYVLVRDPRGRPVHFARDVSSGERLELEFADGRVDVSAGGSGAPAQTRRRPAPATPVQGLLFDGES